MIQGKKVVVVMPAYNAERTIEKTWREVVAQEVVDLVIVVDDREPGRDAGARRGTSTKVVAHAHPRNRGYGANQKTCYRLALDHGADIVVMVHPDYQYTPKLIPAMAGLIASGSIRLRAGLAHSRRAGARAAACRSGGTSRTALLTLVGNLLLGDEALGVPHRLSRLLARCCSNGCRSTPTRTTSSSTTRCSRKRSGSAASIGEVSCPTRYAPDASSITFRRSVRYGFGCLGTAILFRLCRWGVTRSPMFPDQVRASSETANHLK